MGLKGSGWVKKLLRTDQRLQRSMHYASYSRARRNQKPKEQQGRGPGTEPGFGVVMVELMLRKHALVKGCQSLEHFAKRWRELAQEQIKRFPDAHTFVFLFDDETNVPLAKGKTQNKRRISGGLSDFELKELGDKYRRLCNSDPQGFGRCITQLFAKEAVQRKRDGRMAVTPFEVFMSKHMLTKGTREDEFEFATRCITACAYADLGPNRRIIIDRGVWRSSFERRIETDPLKGAEEPWHRAVASFSTTTTMNQQQQPQQLEDGAARAWILIDKWGVRRLDGMEGQYIVGEADLKIPRYARVFAGQDVYVVCHDTDVLPILLMVVKDWVPPKGRCQGKLWLDMTTPSDDDRKHKEPLRGVVDIIQLWRDIQIWFFERFPGVYNPVEVFCLMLVSMGTDYLSNPKNMGPVRLWKAFEADKPRAAIEQALITDGHLGAALPPTLDKAQLLTAQYFSSATSAEEAAERATQTLTRDTTEGTFWDPQQSGRGLKQCPPNHQGRHISLHESAVANFCLYAYDHAGPKDATKWPNQGWRRGYARRLGWQMAYWYGGDRESGRLLENEMESHPENGDSLYGWKWEPDPDNNGHSNSNSSNNTVTTKATDQSGQSKRKAGWLDRHKPYGMVSAPSDHVLELSHLQEYRRQQRQHCMRKLNTNTTTTTIRESSLSPPNKRQKTH